VNAGPRHRFTVSGKVVSNCNFGFLYGMQAEKFVIYAKMNYGINLTIRQSQEFRHLYFKEYAGLEKWHKETMAEGLHYRLSRTPLGRLRYMDPKAYNEYLNHPVQGAGADGLKMALREVYFRLKQFEGRAKIVHHVHDEIILEVDDEPDLLKAAAEAECSAMCDAMKRTMSRVSVEAEPGVGASWADK